MTGKESLFGELDSSLPLLKGYTISFLSERLGLRFLFLLFAIMEQNPRSSHKWPYFFSLDWDGFFSLYSQCGFYQNRQPLAEEALR